MEKRVSRAALLVPIVMAGCGGAPQPASDVPPQAAPLPTAGMAGQRVTVYPLTLLASDRALGWTELVGPREEALRRADSLIAGFVQERAPEVVWVLPDELRRAARRAPGMLTQPDLMGTAILRGGNSKGVPDPLRSQMRALTGVAGERYALVPASVVFVPGRNGAGRAELTVAITDVRRGLIEWRTTAWGEGTDPWEALWQALTTLVPGLP